jgi:hypothetical protein
VESVQRKGGKCGKSRRKKMEKVLKKENIPYAKADKI